MALTKTQKDIVVGALLGDGSLEYNKFKASRLQFKQAERKKEYVLWLYQYFTDVVRTPPKQRLDTRQWYFSTRSLRELEHFRNLFYTGGRKIVPKSLEGDGISPLTLAIWFMDDGTLDYREKYHYSFSLSTDSFSVEEVSILQRILRKGFGIDSSIQTPSSRGKRYTKLYIGKSGREAFLEIIKPYILPCFAYKVPPYCHLTPQRLISSSPSVADDE